MQIQGEEESGEFIPVIAVSRSTGGKLSRPVSAAPHNRTTKSKGAYRILQRGPSSIFTGHQKASYNFQNGAASNIMLMSRLNSQGLMNADGTNKPGSAKRQSRKKKT